MIKKNYKKIAKVNTLLMLIINIINNFFFYLNNDCKFSNNNFTATIIMIAIFHFTFSLYILKIMDKKFVKENMKNKFIHTAVRLAYIKFLTLLIKKNLYNKNPKIDIYIILELIITVTLLSVTRKFLKYIGINNNILNIVIEIFFITIVNQYLVYGTISTNNFISFFGWVIGIIIYHMYVKKKITPKIPKYTIIPIKH